MNRLFNFNIISKNNNTEVIYESLWSCSKALNINSGTIHEKTCSGTIYKKRYIFNYE